MTYQQVANVLKDSVMDGRCLYVIAAFLFIFAILLLKPKRKKKKKKLFYNTGFKFIFSAWDRIKFKVRLGDYDDYVGIRYIYLFEIKIFGFDFFRIKYIDQKKKIHKRKIRFGGK